MFLTICPSRTSILSTSLKGSGPQKLIILHLWRSVWTFLHMNCIIILLQFMFWRLFKNMSKENINNTSLNGSGPQNWSSYISGGVSERFYTWIVSSSCCSSVFRHQFYHHLITIHVFSNNFRLVTCTELLLKTFWQQNWSLYISGGLPERFQTPILSSSYYNSCLSFMLMHYVYSNLVFV